MKAAVWYKKNDIRVEEVQDLQTGPGKVKIRIKWGGICGSDLHEYLAGPVFIPVGQPHPLTGDMAPIVFGHEFSGEIAEVGEGVTQFKVGDRVVAEPIISCGKCHVCKEGLYNLCPNLAVVGSSGNCGGGFAEYAVVSADYTYKIPDTVTFEQAALIEPVSVAFHAIRKAKFMTGQTALILGCGPIGLSAIACLKAAGAKLIIAVEKEAIRMQYAKDAGANYVLNPDEVNVLEEIMKITEGIGVDTAFETTGHQAGFDIGLIATKVCGTFVIISIWMSPLSFNPNAVLFTEKTITGIMGYRREFPMVLALMADGRINIDKFITKKIHLDDIVPEGFEALKGSGKSSHIKILVTPDKSLL